MPLALNLTLGHYTALLAGGTVHALYAEQTYPQACPAGCPECSFSGQSITVLFSHWRSDLGAGDQGADPPLSTVPSTETVTINASCV